MATAREKATQIKIYTMPQLKMYQKFCDTFMTGKATDKGVRIAQAAFDTNGFDIMLNIVGTYADGKPEDRLLENSVIEALKDQEMFFKNNLQHVSADTLPGNLPGVTAMRVTFRPLLDRPLLDHLGRCTIDTFHQRPE